MAGQTQEFQKKKLHTSNSPLGKTCRLAWRWEDTAGGWLPGPCGAVCRVSQPQTEPFARELPSPRISGRLQRQPGRLDAGGLADRFGMAPALRHAVRRAGAEHLTRAEAWRVASYQRPPGRCQRAEPRSDSAVSTERVPQKKPAKTWKNIVVAVSLACSADPKRV